LDTDATVAKGTTEPSSISVAVSPAVDGKREYISQDMSPIKMANSTAITFATFRFISPNPLQVTIKDDGNQSELFLQSSEDLVRNLRRNNFKNF
jgi:hypothetical protein